MPSDALKIINPGWYRVLGVFTTGKVRYRQRKIFVASAKRAAVVDKTGQCWYEFETPDGLIYLRLELAAPAKRPCHCPRLSFPHRRTRNCIGEYHG